MSAKNDQTTEFNSAAVEICYILNQSQDPPQPIQPPISLLISPPQYRRRNVQAPDIPSEREKETVRSVTSGVVDKWNVLSPFRRYAKWVSASKWPHPLENASTLGFSDISDILARSPPKGARQVKGASEIIIWIDLLPKPFCVTPSA
ncbi:hypothetical protein LTR06_011197 [Exophiala xenobiotica]|nr:hypothetical protein LTR06_011197 [Exophiala xenobiotica]